jgi:hypothetical protein
MNYTLEYRLGIPKVKILYSPLVLCIYEDKQPKLINLSPCSFWLDFPNSFYDHFYPVTKLPGNKSNQLYHTKIITSLILKVEGGDVFLWVVRSRRQGSSNLRSWRMYLHGEHII